MLSDLLRWPAWRTPLFFISVSHFLSSQTISRPRLHKISSSLYRCPDWVSTCGEPKASQRLVVDMLTSQKNYADQTMWVLKTDHPAELGMLSQRSENSLIWRKRKFWGRQSLFKQNKRDEKSTAMRASRFKINNNCPTNNLLIGHFLRWNGRNVQICPFATTQERLSAATHITRFKLHHSQTRKISKSRQAGNRNMAIFDAWDRTLEEHRKDLSSALNHNSRIWEK